MKIVERYDFFELRIQTDREPIAVFSCCDNSITIRGFQIDVNEYAVRFMPGNIGVWTYIIESENINGEFECVVNTGNNHGPVSVNGMSFTYADGGTYVPAGTTCYAWIHQTPSLIAKTLESLASAIFNKVRMCVFPKSMPYNNNDPELYPFERNSEGKWDINKPDFRFWSHLESMIKKLCELGIEADLILFHPYDRWGFVQLSHNESLTYLDYCIRRLSAYRNIWWSLANEYDLVPNKNTDNWDEIGQTLDSNDLNNHLISIHHCFVPYPKRDWMTHCSMQTKEVKKVRQWRREYNLPIIVDECGYEGNIEFEWGNLSAFELVDRAWLTILCGGFITHGETFWQDDEVLWWAKGGVLHGESPARFEFLKKLLYELGTMNPFEIVKMNANPNGMSEVQQKQANKFFNMLSNLPETLKNQILMEVTPLVLQNKDYKLQYFGRSRSLFTDIQLSENEKYKVEIIDVWEMTREEALSEESGNIRVRLPKKEGIAVLSTRMDGEMWKYKNCAVHAHR